MSNLRQLDVTDFKMTRLSDVIDQGLLVGGLGNIEISELDESNLEELDHLIEKIQHPLKTPQDNSKLFLEKDEPLKATRVNIQQESTEKVLKETKYTRDELLMLASSPASKLPPPGWDQVVNQLPSAITIGKGFTTSKQEQLRKELNPGEDQGHTIFKASTFPSDSLFKASTATNDSAETEQTGNKNTFIDNLIHEKFVNRTLDQSLLKVKESSSCRQKITISPSAASLPCSKPSFPCNKPSIPCSKPFIPCSKPSITCCKTSIPCSKPSITCSKPSITYSKPSITCSNPSLPCSKPSITCSKPSITYSKSSITCSKPSFPCSTPSITCSKPSITCTKPSLSCSKASLTCSICKELCKRGVGLPCCDAKACRYCAVKTLTDIVSNVSRKCWNCGKTPVSTLDLIVDHNLREAVQRFNGTEFGRN